MLTVNYLTRLAVTGVSQTLIS